MRWSKNYNPRNMSSTVVGMGMNQSTVSKNELFNRYFRKRIAGWLVLIFFVSVWMFILGILVGRGTLPVFFKTDKLQNELNALKEAEIRKEKGRVKIGSGSQGKKTDLKFYEELKETDNQKKRSVRKTKKPSVGSPKIKKTDRGKQDVKKSDQFATKRFTIQVASFRDLKDAKKMVYTLNKKGYSAYRMMGKIPEKGIWYRVRIGNFDSWEQADQALMKLRTDNFSGFIVNRKGE